MKKTTMVKKPLLYPVKKKSYSVAILLALVASRGHAITLRESLAQISSTPELILA